MSYPRPPGGPQATKLTWAKARAIRRLHAAGASYGQIEARFGISRQWAIAVVKGRAWKTSGRLEPAD